MDGPELINYDNHLVVPFWHVMCAQKTKKSATEIGIQVAIVPFAPQSAEKTVELASNMPLWLGSS